MVVALAVQRRGIMDLGKEFQQLSIADGLRIEGNLNGFRVIAVVGYVAFGISPPV